MDNYFNSQDALVKLRSLQQVGHRCHYCGNNTFSIEGKYAVIGTGDDFNTINIGQYIPSAIMICNKCGNIQLFALGALGLLKPKEGIKDE